MSHQRTGRLEHLPKDTCSPVLEGINCLNVRIASTCVESPSTALEEAESTVRGIQASRKKLSRIQKENGCEDKSIMKEWLSTFSTDAKNK